MPVQIDWYYQRASCEACAKSRALLVRRRAVIVETVDARTVRFGRAAAIQLARGATKVIATRGRGAVEFDMRGNPPDDDQLARALLGPTGNLKAPTIRIGKRMVVGFNAATFAAALQ